MTRSWLLRAAHKRHRSQDTALFGLSCSPVVTTEHVGVSIKTSIDKNECSGPDPER